MLPILNASAPVSYILLPKLTLTSWKWNLQFRFWEHAPEIEMIAPFAEMLLPNLIKFNFNFGSVLPKMKTVKIVLLSY